MASTHLPKALDHTKLKAFENAAAGHDGVLSDESGELIIKPCTASEVDFYQESLTKHPKFYELMPTFMGTLTLGPLTTNTIAAAAATAAADYAAAAAAAAGTTTATTDDILPTELSEEQRDKTLLHGKKISTETALVLENLEYRFYRPNVLDLKLGARLYAEGTNPEKAARLDRVAAETTSGSLYFRIAGMKVWNGQSFTIYDKFYGRQFTRNTVHEGFSTFFASLASSNDTDVAKPYARELLETILAEVTKARHSLESSESRMYGASLLIIYEGDSAALATLMGEEYAPPRTSEQGDERAPTKDEVEQREQEAEAEEAEEAEVDDGEEEEGAEGEEVLRSTPTTHSVKMIDFAHAAWTPGQGPDENVILGLKNIENQFNLLIPRF